MKHLFFTTVATQIATQMGDLVVRLGAAAGLMMQKSDGLAANLGLRATPNSGLDGHLTIALAFNDHHGTTLLDHSGQPSILRTSLLLLGRLQPGFDLGQRLGLPRVLLH